MAETYDNSNEAQIQRAQTEALLKSGVALRFHNKSLDSMRGGPAIKQMFISGELLDMTHEGKGLTVVTHDLDGSDIFTLIAKGFMLGVGEGVQVLDPLKIIDAYTNEWADRIERIRTVQNLFISGFVEDGESPFPKQQAYRIEKIILERHAAKRPTFLEVFQECEMKDWWSRKFSKAMLEINKEIRV